MSFALAFGLGSIRAVLIVGRAGAGGWSDGPTEARQADGAELAVVLVAEEGRQRVVYADPAVAPLALGGRRVVARPMPAGVTVRWFKVEPHAWREPGLVAPNGASTAYYSNVVTGGARHGAWLGYDRITYFETALGGFGAETRRTADARPSEPDADGAAGLGTMRYKAEVRLPDGRLLATPGAASTDAYGIRRDVHRVSLRRDDSFNGWLSSYFLVPEVFGSAGPGRNHQTERYAGADCADVLVGALRASGRTVPYSHVAGLTDYADVVAAPVELDDDGRSVEPIAGVRSGDVIRIDYGAAFAVDTPRSWDHVAVLWEDRSDPRGPARGGPDGRLDGFDLVAHMGHPRLVVEELREQTPARIDVLRWNPRKLGRARHSAGWKE